MIQNEAKYKRNRLFERVGANLAAFSRGEAAQHGRQKSKNLAQKELAFRRKRSVTEWTGADAFRDLPPPGRLFGRGWGRAADRVALTQKEIPVTSDVQRNGTTPIVPPLSTTYRPVWFDPKDRRTFIGGSDARIIMGDDEAHLTRLRLEKRGETDPEDLSENLVVQLGSVTENLNRRWYERNTGHAIKDVQKQIQHPVHKWMAATLDGLVEATGAVFEAKFMLPWTFSEEAAAEKHMAQLQHNMWVDRVEDRRCSRSSPVAASGSRSRFTPIRCTSTS